MTADEMIGRYIFEVTRRVPRAQREETERELRELIGDMLEAAGGEEHIGSVLKELGDPAKFARKYRGDNCYLIGPEFYDNYIWVLRIVLICAAGGLVIAALAALIFADSIFDVGETLVSIPGALLGAFGAVTLIFAVMEHLHIRIDLKDGQPEWQPSMLPATPSKQARISRGDTVVSIVFTAIFATLILFAPQFFSLWHIQNDTLEWIPLFNTEVWGTVALLWVLSLMIGLVCDIVKLVKGRWCVSVMIVEIVCGLAQLALLAILLLGFPVWNTELIAQATQPSMVWPDDFMRMFEQAEVLFENGGVILSQCIVALVSMCTFFSLASAIYKTARYGRE